MSRNECKVRESARSSDVRSRRYATAYGGRDVYAYPGPPAEFDVAAPTRRFGTELTVVSYRSVLPSGFDRNDTVSARLFQAEVCDWSRPVVLLHGLAFSRLSMWDSFAAALARRGFPVLLVGLPFTCERTPPGEACGAAYMRIGPATALPAYEQAVADVRSALDWLLAGPVARRLGNVSASSPALVGISLGAFIGVIAAALEPRFRSVVPALGGADLDTVVFGGTYSARMKLQMARAGIRPEQRKEAREAYARFIDEVRLADHPLDVPSPFRFFLFDPMTFAGSLRDRPVLQLSAIFDPVVPARAARKLWLEMGMPEICWMWGTHWVGGPWRPFVTRRIARFLRGTGSHGRGAAAWPSVTDPFQEALPPGQRPAYRLPRASGGTGLR
jgi:pimeloyl-ACP methyl ester carboxylesterase